MYSDVEVRKELGMLCSGFPKLP